MNRAFPAFLIALSFAVAACSGSTRERRLDEKLAAQPELRSGLEVDAKARELSREAPGLTPAQRQHLDQLRQHVRDRLAAIGAESLKLRSVLVDDVLSPQPNLAEIAAVKKRLRKLSDERLDTLFGAADETNEVLGRGKMLREAMDLQYLEDQLSW